MKIAEAASTSPSVTTVMVSSASAPTTKGRTPCRLISRKSVFSPTPAKVSRKAQRDRFASEATWVLSKTWNVASSETKRKPRTNLWNFCQRKAALPSTAFACPR